jgi:hypothetical protein
VPKRHDDLGDSFPNDWLESLIIVTALIAMSGGAYALYYLAQQMPVVN